VSLITEGILAGTLQLQMARMKFLGCRTIECTIYLCAATVESWWGRLEQKMLARISF